MTKLSIDRLVFCKSQRMIVLHTPKVAEILHEALRFSYVGK